MKYPLGDSAEMDKNYIVRGRGWCQVLVTPRHTALKLFPEKVFWSDHNNNLKWVILET
jgi:hypothetical protein